MTYFSYKFRTRGTFFSQIYVAFYNVEKLIRSNPAIYTLYFFFFLSRLLSHLISIFLLQLKTGYNLPSPSTHRPVTFSSHKVLARLHRKPPQQLQVALTPAIPDTLARPFFAVYNSEISDRILSPPKRRRTARISLGASLPLHSSSLADSLKTGDDRTYNDVTRAVRRFNYVPVHLSLCLCPFLSVSVCV